MKVPFLDLKAHHDPIRDEVMAAIAEVVDTNAFAGGPFVARFEEEYAAYCGTKYCVGVGNGTDALWLALLGLGVGPGDEVITVPMTFMATTEAISYTGARPVFVDIDPVTYTMDASQLEAAITPRTKAIIPVHLFGQCADMDAILAVARRHELFVVEDAAQAQGAIYQTRLGPGATSADLRSPNSELRPAKAGSMGDAGAFSFYPGKNLGAWGEAGAVTTNDANLAERMRMFREHGQQKKYYHDVIGWNARMDGIQAAVLRVKLKYLNRANDGRRAAAALYGKLLADLPGLTLPVEADYARHIYHVYATRVAARDEVMKRLADRQVGSGIHYPVPVHLQKAYADLGHGRGSFPVAERCADEFLSLPMYPELTRAHIDAVIDACRDALSASVAR